MQVNIKTYSKSEIHIYIAMSGRSLDVVDLKNIASFFFNKEKQFCKKENLDQAFSSKKLFTIGSPFTAQFSSLECRQCL